MPGPPMFVPRRRLRRGAVLTLVFAAALATGAATGSWGADARQGLPSTARAPLAAGTEDGKAPGPSAARPRGPAAPDRWGGVYSAREYQGFERSLRGEYVGVGLSVRRLGDGAMEVEGVEQGGPAARAGITPGDRLRTVDGVEVTGRPVTDVVARLRGGPSGTGSPVRLGLDRAGRSAAGEGAVRERTLRRERLRTRSVVSDRFRDGAAAGTRIKVASFTRGTGRAVREAVRAAGPREGVLLDLRGNAGGLVTEAVTTASAFLDGGLVATYDVHGRQRALSARPGGDTRRPLVVLVDGGTMSAGELLAGALQDRGRAVLVGSRTFGKDSVQMPRALPDGSVAEQTVGHWRTPAGRTVEDGGLTPDLVVHGDPEPRARAVLGGLGPGS
ncbi:PDZ domain-containing protein [Streptomyces sp. AV19]|uniref:S41 family peptidase n=1 Tax=Streptomyces sp. AV19 TaxID=2793068 RepID=UPI0018FE94D4|nr:S41 family peptidase [Streptomyces sp. AV19]MBH1932757.1 PDZ domain-containing protein [Streptomyces sp. AV19]MDG4531428.1 S41 family peptidase [Streptomyces sp. AV19]